jgi:uncharacterized protein YfaT (DUF1175 family)
MARKLVTRRPPIDQMTSEQMRAYLVEQADAARTRGLEYRKKQRKQGLVRFSCFIPETLKDEVGKAVRDVLARHRVAGSVSVPSYDLSPPDGES